MKYIKTFEKISKTNPIIDSAKRGSVSGIEKAIKAGYDVNRGDDYNRTPLMVAVASNYISVVNCLIKNNADVNLRDGGGRTALMMANTSKIINILINAGADVNIASNKGETAIMEYLRHQYESEKFIQYLILFLEHGLDLDQTNNDGDNLYDLIKKYKESWTNSSSYYNDIEKYMNKKYPKYKEYWDFKNDIQKYNV